jgi:hypothetical protein
MPAQGLARAEGGDAAGTSSSDPAGPSDASLLPSLMRHVRDFFSGELTEGNQEKRAALPPALRQRITAYQKEKATLQDILAERIRHEAPGPATRHAIDLFDADNSGRIAALGRMRESIRSDLAQLRATDIPPPDGQPLDALLREFAIDIRQLERPPANAD